MRRFIRGFCKLVFSRIMVIALLLALQIGVLFAGYRLLGRYMGFLLGAGTALSVFLIFYIINKEGDPAYKLVWMIPICGVPVFGTLLYLYVELDPGGMRVRRSLTRSRVETANCLRTTGAVRAAIEEAGEELPNLAAYLQERCGYAAFGDTDVTYFPQGEDKYRSLLRDLKAAKRFIFLEYFIIAEGKMWNSILEILREKVREGVEVRLLYDGTCSLLHLPMRYPEHLKAMGIQVRVFAPIRPLLSTVQNNRDHRKIAAIDGRIAYTGGVNLADEYINEKERFGHWKDTAIRLEGEGAQGLTLLFLQGWNMAGPAAGAVTDYICAQSQQKPDPAKGFVIPFGDAPADPETIGANVYIDILYHAKRYVHIATPYLIINHEMERALTYAAKRGVEVSIILPHIPDKKYAFYIARTYYPTLLRAGIELYEYRPGFIHAKSFVSDDVKAVVGTINLDYRSLYLHYECGVYLYRTPAVAEVERDFVRTREQCIRVDADYYWSIGTLQKLAGRALRLFGPLM